MKYCMISKSLNRKIGTLLFFLLFPLSVMAQVNVSGTVLDDNNQPLELASARLLNTQGKMIKGAVTDKNGSFMLPGISSGNYILQISYVGMEDYKKPLQVKNTHISVGKIGLDTGGGKQLEGVVVTGKAADVVVKNDTLEFNPGSYNLQTGASLEELIKKLPGAEVDDQGNITINGKSISKIMVDGKPFFSNDPKVASKNLPADMVQRLQVLDKQTDMARMSGFDDGEEETVINLKIKPEKKKGFFGSAYAGAGTDKRWEANASINRFSGDSQWTLLVGGNNTNNMGFSDIGVDSQTGMPRGFGRFGNQGVTTSSTIGTNVAHVFSPKFELGGNLNYGFADMLVEKHVEQQNLLSTGSTTQIQDTRNTGRTHNGGTTMRIEWKPDDKTELVIEPYLNMSKGKTNMREDFGTTNDADGSTVNKGYSEQIADTKYLDASVNADFSRRLGDNGRTLSLSMRANVGNNASDGIYHSYLIKGDGVELQNTNQLLNNLSRNWGMRTRLSWVEPLGKNYFMQGLYQIRYSDRNSLRDAFGMDAAGKYETPLMEYSRNFSNSMLTHTFGLNIKKKGSNYDLTAGINLDPNTTRSFSEVGGVKTDPIKLNRLNYSPSIRFNYIPNKNTSFALRYRGNTNQPSVQQMMPVPDITNPLIEYVGNPSLRPSYENTVRMHFRTYDPKSKSSLALFAGGNYTIDDIVSGSVYDVTSGKRTVEYKNVSGNWRAMIGGFATMPIGKSNFSVRLNTFNMMNRNIGYVNGEENSARTLMLNDNLTLVYRNNWLDTEVSGGMRFMKVDNSLQIKNQVKNTFDYNLGHRTTVKLPYNFDLEYDLTYKTNSGYSDSYLVKEWILNGGLSYSFLKDRSMTIRLKGYDILNQRSNITRSNTALAIRTESTNTLGSYVMLHLIYRFNIFSSGGTRSDMNTGNRPGFGGGFRPH